MNRGMTMERVTVLDMDGVPRTMHVVARKGRHAEIAEHSLRKGQRFIVSEDPTSYAAKERARRRAAPVIRWDSNR